jgi:tetratricopeptide (TPR) repeat protein
MQGKYSEAIKAYDKAIEMNPQLIQAWISKGFALNSLAKYDEAIKAFDQVIRIAPQFAQAWYNRGLALKALGRTAEAEISFAKANELGL